jgi:hypothetical protein
VIFRGCYDSHFYIAHSFEEFDWGSVVRLCDEVLKGISNQVSHQSMEIVCEGDLEWEIVKAC